MILNNDSIKTHIPYYLTQDAKQELIRALNDFPEKVNYYTSRYSADVLQGDGMKGLQIINFENGERKYTKGILLSNSCDMDINNKREFPIKLIFASLIKLDKYISLLKQKGFEQDKIDNKIRSIKEQKITYIFYLPKNGSLETDHIALLNDLYTIPLSALEKTDKNSKLFTLSQVGFYLFVFKLSVHFCRFHENIER